MNRDVGMTLGSWKRSTVGLVLILIGIGSVPAQAQKAVLKMPLTVYQQPDVTSGVVADVAAGDTILVVARDGAWVQVKTSRGLYGWFPLGVEKRNGSTTDAPTEVSSTREPPEKPATPRRPSSNGSTTKLRTSPSSVSTMRSWPRPRHTDFTFDMGTFEGNFSYLLRLVRRQSASFALEGRFGHVLNPDASTFLLSAGVIYQPVRWGPIEPYVAIGFGLVNTVPKQIETAQSVTNPAANYGFGLEWPLGGRLALRTEFRQHSVFVNGSNVNRQGFTLGVVLGRFQP